jgi:hypothetical protein
VRSYFGERKILLQKVKIVAKPLVLQKKVLSTNVFIGAHSTQVSLFGSIRDSRTTENLFTYSREWEWELTFFFREWDRDWDSRKCLFLMQGVFSGVHVALK